jgi:Tetratricopeptide repeat
MWRGNAEAGYPTEQNLAERLRTLGPDHPDTLVSRNNLATAHQRAGRLAEAIPLYEQILAERLTVLSADHPDTLVSRNNAASAYEWGGRLAEAISLYEQILAERLTVLGADHPQTQLLRQQHESTLLTSPRAAITRPAGAAHAARRSGAMTTTSGYNDAGHRRGSLRGEHCCGQHPRRRCPWWITRGSERSRSRRHRRSELLDAPGLEARQQHVSGGSGPGLCRACRGIWPVGV